MFAVGNGMFFEAIEAGHVRIVSTRDGKEPSRDCSNVEFDRTVNDGIWGSIVLSMTEYGERPNDWHKWMDHHHGRCDVLA